MEVELFVYIREFVRDVLDKEIGLWVGWNENGGLFIVNNKERLDEYKRLMIVSYFVLVVFIIFIVWIMFRFF